MSTSDNILCSVCIENLAYSTNDDIKTHFIEYFEGNKIVTGLFSLVNFEKDNPIQSLVHNLKYGNKPFIGNYLGKVFAEKYLCKLNESGIDTIIPVPLFHSKRAERGYNQSYQFAKGISITTGIRVCTNAIKRIRNTETQTHLSREERNENVANAFKVTHKNKVTGKRILIIDDVITTGSTINECAKTLNEAGANKIFAGSIALA